MKLAIFASLLAGCVAASEAASTEQPLVRPQAVQVVNTESDPARVSIVPTSAIPVRDIDAPARHPFAKQVVMFLPDNAQNMFQSLAIPDGQRLVVESISADLRVPPGDTPMVRLWGVAGTDVTGHVYAPTKLMSSSGKDVWVLSGEARPMYLDSVVDHMPTVTVERALLNTGVLTEVSIWITGHLVPLLTAIDGL